jgi:thioredoxin 1
LPAKLLNLRALAILFVVGVVFLSIQCGKNKGEEKFSPSSIPQTKTQEVKKNEGGKTVNNLPVLIDLGKGTCRPCIMMKPILEELQKEYQGKAIVHIIDLRYEPEKAREYKIALIPTQIFYDAKGNEIYRHIGFMDKESIKSKFLEMGID